MCSPKSTKFLLEFLIDISPRNQEELFAPPRADCHEDAGQDGDGVGGDHDGEQNLHAHLVILDG